MHPFKAFGPDGFLVLFFQTYWHIVGPQVIEVVLDFLNNGRFDSRINFTNIVIIPKVKKPSSMAQFRPISLCNIVYKVAAKVLANRLKNIIDDIISVN